MKTRSSDASGKFASACVSLTRRILFSPDSLMLDEGQVFGLGIHGVDLTAIPDPPGKFERKIATTGTEISNGVACTDTNMVDDVSRPVLGRRCFLVEHFQEEPGEHFRL